MTAICENCSAAVSTQYARVLGDNDDTVHACPNCTTLRDVSDGAAADTT
ncbi:DUF7563 family protein [Halomarina rubra]|uniref:Small CPxCG-related zinc finger protein n=1 Tax=Halomarina rubra TaxID=2071873 RepID=A0ABD6B1H4_9EURY|nr:hypothetical protein [Halomarina rubra]